MKKQKLELISSSSLLLTFQFFFLILSSSHVTGGGTSGENPFTPKAYLIRYWNNQIYKVPRPEFLFNKASPLSAADSAKYARLAAGNSLSGHLDSFCKAAGLLCFPDPGSSLEKHSDDVGFSGYSEKNFTNYGTGRAGGKDKFAEYGTGDNIPVNSFRRYSRDAAGHEEEFKAYGNDGNVISQAFNTYGAGATGGDGNFTSYADNVNSPGLQFTSYSDEGNGRNQGFSSYSTEANSGDQKFSNYGKNGNGEINTFKEYGNNSNVVGSTFTSYAKTGNAGSDNFTSYGFNGNVPENKFQNYADGGNSGAETFSSYRDESNVGDDNFKSYAKGSNSEKVNFVNYGRSFNLGSDNFTGYGVGAQGQKIGFKGYGQGNDFKEYAEKGVSFKEYKNTSSENEAKLMVDSEGKKVINKWVEPGKFFRERMLKEGTIMPMPDIRDKMPPRSFLPRSILTKIPFSSSKISELKQTFRAFENSSMESMINSAIQECERAPSPGETKRCVGSAEDMIDFAVSVLGRTVEPRTTRNVNGSKSDILLGKVTGINGGNVTKSVSCHQSLFPYLLYYCHSVPKVRVYEADILDPTSKKKINHGVAICHIDTSVWSPTHGAFLALGPGPGKIEVCHWIFENDLTWTIAD